MTNSLVERAVTGYSDIDRINVILIQAKTLKAFGATLAQKVMLLIYSKRFQSEDK